MLPVVASSKCGAPLPGITFSGTSAAEVRRVANSQTQASRRRVESEPGMLKEE